MILSVLLPTLTGIKKSSSEKGNIFGFGKTCYKRCYIYTITLATTHCLNAIKQCQAKVHFPNSYSQIMKISFLLVLSSLVHMCCSCNKVYTGLDGYTVHCLRVMPNHIASFKNMHHRDPCSNNSAISDFCDML